MADIERRPAVLAVQVVRVDRKVQASLPVRIVLGVAQTVIAKETDRPAKPIVEADEDLILVEVATGFILVNVANVAKRTNSQGLARCSWTTYQTGRNLDRMRLNFAL